MISIRKFAYTALLTLTALNLAPTLASAEESAQGRFKQSHDVHWQNAVIPAGEYRFSYGLSGYPHVLMLSKLDGTRGGYMLPVMETEEAKPSDISRLLLKTTPDGSYVTAMELPAYGMTLHFKVPTPVAEKQIARASTAPLASGR